MSEQLEKLEKLYGDWARGDYSRSDIFDPEMKMETFGMGEPMSADSYEGFVDAMRDWLSAWERPITVAAEKLIESGDQVLAMITWVGRGKGSGAQIESRGAHLWTFRDGLVVYCRIYRDREEARAALVRG